MGERGAFRPDRGGVLSETAIAALIAPLAGGAPRDLALYGRALTHGSAAGENYERLEFLGDRVLGLVMAEWLYAIHPDEKEGQLSSRINALVAGVTCAAVAREMGLPEHVRLGKQARDDGAVESDNVLGDVMEALIGATYLDLGIDAARRMIRTLWEDRVAGRTSVPKHPKSALQEWAAANRRRPPAYAILEKSGPHHALRFRVEVTIAGVGSAQAEGGSKQEAETAAAAALLDKVGS